jgi:hypothetical protein
MGEHALYAGAQIKIGTCEDMYYLRADQAGLVEGLPGNVDPNDPRHRKEIRFRFPWPDEDGTEPGHFEDYDRSLPVPTATIPDEVSHYREHGPGTPELVQQRYWDGALVAVAKCSECRARFRLPYVGDVAPLADGLLSMAAAELAEGNPRESQRLLMITRRMLDGYQLAPALVVA